MADDPTGAGGSSVFHATKTVHEFETRSYADLIAELEHWIARCTVWEREGHWDERRSECCRLTTHCRPSD